MASTPCLHWDVSPVFVPTEQESVFLLQTLPVAVLRKIVLVLFLLQVCHVNLVYLDTTYLMPLVLVNNVNAMAELIHVLMAAANVL